jgi:hypothetical protein
VETVVRWGENLPLGKDLSFKDSLPTLLVFGVKKANFKSFSV